MISFYAVMHLFRVNFGGELNPYYHADYKPAHMMHIFLFIVIWFGSTIWISFKLNIFFPA